MAISNAERAYNLAIRRKKPKIGHIVHKLLRAVAAKKIKEQKGTNEEIQGAFNPILEKIKERMAERLQKKRDKDA